MDIIYGNQLVNLLRKSADTITERLWIAVPFIGGLETTRKIIGRNWIENPKIFIRLLTDTNEFNNFNSETIQLFKNRGEIRHLAGLHAKIFILDNKCLLTSANLTNTAFAKRHEIGIFLDKKHSQKVIDIFEEWWNKSKQVTLENLNVYFKKKIKSKEENSGIGLINLWNLPKDQGELSKNKVKQRFLYYESLVKEYKNFANKYKSIQRIWREQPLYFEVDGFLDYLYAHEDAPSENYDKKSPRTLNSTEQLREIKKWAKRFKQWAGKQKNNDWRLNNSKVIKKYLSPRKIHTLKKGEIYELLINTNAGNSRHGNCNKVKDQNKVLDVINALNFLVNAENKPLPERFSVCSTINGIGTSIMNELLCFCYPDKYPLINKRSNCGLRFFGYNVSVY
ncbi:MAG: hypothetical protein COS14_02315 [Bacteroidetes bacterium CG02_land_8_20_14_3_00_31_25]|nr:MAG: hypothetical protein COS14_02315 [Bacteroidetes bacterium CG02_land_8_20_14_3_00_31_25]PIY07439.1 MAG: hypothetical protein COZ21_00285 [Bacteroidetes bacterium CG_4_10_14_3_um_filter_31_20]